MMPAVIHQPPGPVVVIAHRGASGHAPEHTFAAYDRALEMGAHYIEQDLQQAAGGELVAMHDDTLDRTTDGSGPVSALTVGELKALDAGGWFDPAFAGERIPTLEEVFTRYGDRARYYIETKVPERADRMEERLVELIAAHGLAEAARERWQVVVQSFSAESLRKVHALDPGLPLIQLYRNDGSEAIRATLGATREYAAGIGPARGSVDAELVAAAHEHGLVVHPYTLRTPEEHEALLALGVDGAFSNYPDRFAAALAGRT
jgi:glycerophosphoryl diester phosphodiesterase